MWRVLITWVVLIILCNISLKYIDSDWIIPPEILLPILIPITALLVFEFLMIIE